MALEFNRPSGLCLEGNLAENYKTFEQEVRIYFKATETNKKDNDVQVARLLNLLGHDGLKLYNTLKKDENETVDSILKSLEKYCIPKTNEIMEHFNFFSRKQQEGEQFDIWYTDLKKLIKNCNFGVAEDTLLRTQVVLGIYDKESQTRLLRDELSLLKVVSYCQSVERAENNKKTLTSVIEVDKMVNAVGFKSNWGSREQNQGNMWKKNNAGQKQWEEYKNNGRQTEEKGNNCNVINCNRCGTEHVYRNCPAYGKSCKNCNGYYHFAKMCKKKWQCEKKIRLKKHRKLE